MKKIFTLLLICLFINTYTKCQNIVLPPAKALKIINDTAIANMLPRINADSILSYIQHLQNYGSRFMLKPGHKNISLWLQQKLISFGYNNVVLDSFQVSCEWPSVSGTIITNWQYNVIAEQTGAINPDVQYVIGGHYDAVVASGDPYIACPGADDNASGTAATLEIARVLKEYNFISPATIRIVLFDAEELGLYGSTHYVQEALAANEKPKIMLNLDMIGNEPSDSGWHLQFNCYEGFEWLVFMGAGIATQYTQLGTIGYVFNDIIGSDSDPFFLNGLPAIFFQEDNFSPFYHSLNDVDSNINALYCSEATRVACGMLMESTLTPSIVNFEIFNPGDGQSLKPSWKPNPENNIAGYKVYLGTSPLTYDTVYTTADTLYNISGLTNGTLYYIAVSAVNTEGREGMKYELNGTPVLVKLNQGILIVDDSEGGYYNPSDSTVDAYYRYLCNGFVVSEYDATQNGPVTLADLGPYSSVVWHINRTSIVPKLRNSLTALKQYMQLGGNVFFTIFQPSKMFVYTDGSMHIWREGTFLHDMLKIDTTEEKNSSAFIGAIRLILDYNMLNIDTNKTLPTYNHHLVHIEALFPSAEGVANYSYNSDYDSSTNQGSMIGMPVGVENRGSDYNSVLLSFPLFYMDSIQSKEVMHYVLHDIFGEVPNSLEETKKPDLVSIYPNPAKTSFIIKTSAAFSQQQAVIIYDVTGRQALSVLALSGYENSIDASGLQRGIYFLRLICGNQEFKMPLVILGN